MDGILFLFLAIATIFTSIKIAQYANIMESTTNINGTLIGGLILAAVTSLPEAITCLTAIFINNPFMAIGDIIGSNIFNLLILVVLNIYFFNKMIFNDISFNYFYINALIVYIYIILITFFSEDAKQVFFNIGVPTLLIIISYFFYLFFLGKIKVKKPIISDKNAVDNIKLKFWGFVLLMVVVSVSLTYSADYLSLKNPAISSSAIGAFLIGITTSLPEVVTIYTLLRINSFNLAFANIIGSNMFNLLILSLGDILYPTSIYFFGDKDIILITKFTLYINLILFIYIMKRKPFSKLTYMIPSIIIVLIYLYLWKLVMIG